MNLSTKLITPTRTNSSTRKKLSACTSGVRILVKWNRSTPQVGTSSFSQVLQVGTVVRHVGKFGTLMLMNGTFSLAPFSLTIFAALYFIPICCLPSQFKNSTEGSVHRP